MKRSFAILEDEEDRRILQSGENEKKRPRFSLVFRPQQTYRPSMLSASDKRAFIFDWNSPYSDTLWFIHISLLVSKTTSPYRGLLEAAKDNLSKFPHLPLTNILNWCKFVEKHNGDLEMILKKIEKILPLDMWYKSLIGSCDMKSARHVSTFLLFFDNNNQIFEQSSPLPATFLRQLKKSFLLMRSKKYSCGCKSENDDSQSFEFLAKKSMKILLSLMKTEYLPTTNINVTPAEWMALHIWDETPQQEWRVLAIHAARFLMWNG